MQKEREGDIDFRSKIERDLRSRWEAVLACDFFNLQDAARCLDLIMQQESDIFLLNLYKKKLPPAEMDRPICIMKQYRQALDDLAETLRKSKSRVRLRYQTIH